MQALYQKEIAGHDCNELLRQFHEQVAYERVDKAFFDTALAEICKDESKLLQRVADCADRPVEQLDPIEKSILTIGTWELCNRADIPYRVVINESVNLGKRFGATDSHKYVNACLDRAARDLRASEVDARG